MPQPAGPVAADVRSDNLHQWAKDPGRLGLEASGEFVVGGACPDDKPAGLEDRPPHPVFEPVAPGPRSGVAALGHVERFVPEVALL